MDPDPLGSALIGFPGCGSGYRSKEIYQNLQINKFSAFQKGFCSCVGAGALCVFNMEPNKLCRSNPVKKSKPVVLEVAQGCVHWVGGADPSQTAQREVVVQD